ncbi:cell division protein ZapB [Glaesserella parasuis]|nr:cell division protein ZapB [Glaesserella parasuis]
MKIEKKSNEAIIEPIEEKIKQAVETIQLLQLEVEELKGKNEEANRSSETLRQEHEQLKTEHQNFQDRLRSLLGQIDNV